MNIEDAKIFCSKLYDDYLNNINSLNSLGENDMSHLYKKIFDTNILSYRKILKEAFLEIAQRFSLEESRQIKDELTGKDIYVSISKIIDLNDFKEWEYTNKQLDNHFNLKDSIPGSSQRSSFYYVDFRKRLTSIKSILDFAIKNNIDPLDFLNNSYNVLDCGDELIKQSAYKEMVSGFNEKTEYEILHEALSLWG